MEPAKANGRVNSLQQAIDLVFKVLRKMVERELQMAQAEGTLGILVDFSKMSDEEVLEYFLKTM